MEPTSPNDSAALPQATSFLSAQSPCPALAAGAPVFSVLGGALDGGPRLVTCAPIRVPRYFDVTHALVLIWSGIAVSVNAFARRGAL